MSWEDDIHLGNFSEIGESLRGMQDSHVGAAAKAMHQLRGALGTLAQNRFGAHAPTSKQMRSPYKDSTQIGIFISGVFTPSSWANNGPLPVVTGLTRVYKSFKPTKAILTEIVIATFTNGTNTVKKSASVSDASDLVLVQAFSGADNCFPNAPTESNGISGPTFANNSLGNGISWPTINGGIDMTVGFAIESTVQYVVAAPDGYELDSLEVRIRFNLLGPSLR